MTPDEAREALAQPGNQHARRFTPEESKERQRARNRAVRIAHTALTRRHRDEYKVLYWMACVDAGLNDEGAQ